MKISDQTLCPLKKIAKLEETKECNHEEYMPMEYKHMVHGVELHIKKAWCALLLEDSDPDDVQIKGTNDHLIKALSQPLPRQHPTSLN